MFGPKWRQVALTFPFPTGFFLYTINTQQGKEGKKNLSSLSPSSSSSPYLSSKMEAIGAPSPLSLFSPKRINLGKRASSLLPIASKNKKDDPDLQSESKTTDIVPVFNRQLSISPLSKDAAMGLVLSAATGRGWTTGSGMEGPPTPAESDSTNQMVSTFPWSLFTKSPRRRMRVAFTCNVCGQRTTRAINPHAYTDGTVFVQCCGCNVFHKLVDNLNLFHEMKCYVNPSFRYKGSSSFGFIGGEEDDDNAFPKL